MGQAYKPTETHTLLLQVLRLNNTVPAFPADYSTPQIRIIHESGGSLVTDVASTGMTQLSDNIWFFNFVIPTSPFFGDYTAEFATTISGSDVESSEPFKVE